MDGSCTLVQLPSLIAANGEDCPHGMPEDLSTVLFLVGDTNAQGTTASRIKPLAMDVPAFKKHEPEWSPDAPRSGS